MRDFLKGSIHTSDGRRIPVVEVAAIAAIARCSMDTYRERIEPFVDDLHIGRSDDGDEVRLVTFEWLREHADALRADLDGWVTRQRLRTLN